MGINKSSQSVGTQHGHNVIKAYGRGLQSSKLSEGHSAEGNGRNCVQYSGL